MQTFFRAYSVDAATRMSTTVEVVKTEDTLHGKPRLEGTRVGVLQIGDLARQPGVDPQMVAEELGLTVEQVDVGLEYYEDHPREMDRLRTHQQSTRDQLIEHSRGP